MRKSIVRFAFFRAWPAMPPPVGRLRAKLKNATEGARSAHRLDEFPAGYSSAGCSPAEPASASPTIASLSIIPHALQFNSSEWYPLQLRVSQQRGSLQIRYGRGD